VRKNQNPALLARSVRGGILADACGVGKTLQTVATMVDGKRTKRPRVNLIIVPPTLLHHWPAEIEKQCDKEYNDQCMLWKDIAPLEKKAAEAVIARAWIVVATFPEIRKADCVLRSLKWHRIIVDEAHGMRNTQTNLFKSLCTIEAEYRWVLSATALVNKVDEIYSYLKFLRLSGTESRKKFNKKYGFVKDKGGAGKKGFKLEEVLKVLVLGRNENTTYFGVKTVNVEDSTDCIIPVGVISLKR
jgi:SNF2 family DNA or RNA helicase